MKYLHGVLILQENSCIVKIYASQCSFDSGFHCLNSCNIKRVVDENCTNISDS